MCVKSDGAAVGDIGRAQGQGANEKIPVVRNESMVLEGGIDIIPEVILQQLRCELDKVLISEQVLLVLVRQTNFRTLSQFPDDIVRAVPPQTVDPAAPEEGQKRVFQSEDVDIGVFLLEDLDEYLLDDFRGKSRRARR